MIKASKGQVHYINKPGSETNICIKGLPEPWSGGYTYLTLEQAEELKEQLILALSKDSKLIFD